MSTKAAASTDAEIFNCINPECAVKVGRSTKLCHKNWLISTKAMFSTDAELDGNGSSDYAALVSSGSPVVSDCAVTVSSESPVVSETTDNNAIETVIKSYIDGWQRKNTQTHMKH